MFTISHSIFGGVFSEQLFPFEMTLFTRKPATFAYFRSWTTKTKKKYSKMNVSITIHSDFIKFVQMSSILTSTNVLSSVYIFMRDFRWRFTQNQNSSMNGLKQEFHVKHTQMGESNQKSKKKKQPQTKIFANSDVDEQCEF